MSPNPTLVTIKMPLAREAMGNHLMKSTSLEKTRSPVSGFCYAQNRVCNAVIRYVLYKETERIGLNGLKGGVGGRISIRI